MEGQKPLEKLKINYMIRTTILQRLSAFILLFVVFATNGQTIQLGSGTNVTGTTEAAPINIYYRSMHMQIVYTAAELNAAGVHSGNLSSLGFYVESGPSYNLPNFKIAIRHTSASDASSNIVGPFYTIYSNPSFAPTPGGFDMLSLDSNFNWNGTDNIALDICFDRVPNYTSTGRVRYYTDGNNVGYTRSDGANQCSNNVSSTSSRKPQIQMQFIPNLANNASVTASNLSEIVCAGLNSVKATVGNLGNNQIDSVMVGWSVNGALQTPFKYVGTLDTINGSGSRFAEVTLGNFTFVSGTSYNISIFSYLPNNAADAFLSDDTLDLASTVGLGGTYSIGGGGADYGSFTAALNDLSTKGVCDSVIFQVASGTYTEQISFPEIPGVGADKHIRFKGVAGDSSAVKLTYGLSNFNANYTLEFDGANYISFSDLTIEATNNSYDRVVFIANESEYISFWNCAILNNAVTTPFNYNLVEVETSSNSDYIRISNSFFFNGSGGFYSNGSNADYLNVSGNVFLNQAYDGVYINGANYVTVNSNSIHTNSNNSFIAIELRYCDSTVSVQKNKISNVRGQGINLDYCDGAANNRNIVANNFVHISGNSFSAEGIDIISSPYLDIFYNSVNSVSSDDQNIGLRVSSGNNVRIYNNNIAVKGGEAFYINNNNTVSESDHNNFYKESGILGYWQGDVADLAALHTMSNQDSNSLSEAPFFLNDTSYQSAQIALNNSGMPISGFLVDIENESRDATNPDIGADEFTPTSLDAGVYDISLPQIPFAAGSLPVKAILRNFGGQTITSATLNWSLNGVAQAPVNFNGSLNSGDTVSVLLGNLNFTETDLHKVSAYSSNPNGGLDAIALNDTLVKGAITPALDGAYTIGGLNPDFTDFTAATSVLNLGGIKNHVTFNVRSGNYNERLTFTNFPKVNENDTVNFQSETLDSSAVQLTASYTNTDENYVIRLNGTKGIGFSHLTIRNNSFNSYSRVIQLDSGAAHVHFENCDLIAGPTTSSSTSVFYAYNSNNNSPEMHDITINASTLRNGYYSIYLVSRVGRAYNIWISNSSIIDPYRSGININDHDSIFIDKNTIIPKSTATPSFQGIYLYDTKMGKISGNKIWAPSSEDGIYTYQIEGSNTDPFVISNNFISVGGSSSNGYGIELYRANYTKVVHNSILSTNSNTSAAAFNEDYSFFNGSNGLEVLNNIFQNTGGGYAIKVDHSSTSTVFNYNSLFNTGANIGSWGGTNAATFTDWQNTSAHDGNSIFADALFENDTNLHVNATSLNKKAFLLSYISQDIDGDVRDATNPDIGADEFTPVGDDAGILSLQGPLKPFLPGNQNVYIQLLNNGADTLKTLNLNWEVNGQLQAVYSFIGNIPSGESLDSVNIGSFNFIEDSTYSLRIYSSLPNGNVDALTSNDTLFEEGIVSALSGDYTIGGLNPSFNSFTEANTALRQRGISSWVRFNVRDGVYNETMLMRPIVGSLDEGDSIVFVSENGDASLVNLTTSQYSPTLVELRGAEHVTFRDLTLSTTYLFNGLGLVNIDSTSTNISFQNCVFRDTLYGTSGDVLVRTSSSYNNPNTHIENCSFENGRYGIDARGNGGTRETGLIIENSTFTNQYYRGIYFDDQEDFTIMGNTISSNRGYTGFYGIYGYTSRNGGEISKNTILGNTDDGIYLYDVDGTNGNSVVVANNFVQMVGSSFASGIYISSCNYINVAYNSVRSFNTNSSTEAFYEVSCTHVEVFNNIFQNDGGGYAVDVDGYNNYQQNFNNLYTSGATLGIYRSSSYSNLTDFSNASNFDTSSVSLLSQFTDSNNVHVEAANLNGAGTPLTYVDEDYDGNFRDPNTPDIGADEFSVNTNDAALTALSSPNKPFPSGVNPVYVNLLNNGLDTLRSVQINWSVNGVAQTSLNWTGAIGTGDQDSVAIGNFNFATATFHDIVASTSLPNGQIDILATNDTTGALDLYPALSGAYTLGGGAADFPDFSSAVSALDAGGVLGWVHFNVNDGTYNEQISFSEIAGASASDSVVFQSVSGNSASVVLSYNANNTDKYTVLFDNADNISFKDMTIQALNTGNGLVVQLKNNTSNIQLDNIIFSMPTSSSFNLQGVSGSNDIDNLRITNCSFANGHSGIYLNVNNSPGLIIRGNSFKNQYRNGAYIQNLDGPIISENQISATNTNSSFTGLYLYNIEDGFKVEKNKIYIPFLGQGIYAYDLDGTIANRGLIANNFVTIGDSTASSIGTEAFDVRFCSHLDIAYNSANHASSDGYAFYMSSNTSTLHFQNNLAVSSGGDYAFFQSGTSPLSNYNNFHSTGATPFYHSSFGGNISNLASWKTATSLDANSLDVDPLFTSESDLHITQSALDSTATPLSFVNQDRW